jgi:hypothetical protein
VHTLRLKAHASYHERHKKNNFQINCEFNFSGKGVFPPPFPLI